MFGGGTTAEPVPPAAVVEWFVDVLGLDASRAVAVLTPPATADALRARCPRLAEPEPADPADPAASGSRAPAPHGAVADDPVPRITWPLAAGAVHAAVLATDVDPQVARQTLDEVLRVLTAGGRIGIAETVLDQRYGFVRRLERLLDPRAEAARTRRAGAWAAALADDARFRTLRRQSFQHVRLAMPTALAVEIVGRPEVAALPPQDREGLVEHVARVATDEVREDGLVELPYRVDAAWTDRV